MPISQAVSGPSIHTLEPRTNACPYSQPQRIPHAQPMLTPRLYPRPSPRAHNHCCLSVLQTWSPQLWPMPIHVTTVTFLIQVYLCEPTSGSAKTTRVSPNLCLPPLGFQMTSVEPLSSQRQALRHQATPQHGPLSYGCHKVLVHPTLLRQRSDPSRTAPVLSALTAALPGGGGGGTDQGAQPKPITGLRRPVALHWS